MNPYDPPVPSGNVSERHAPNPVSTLLAILGVLCVFQGVVAIPVGLFIGPHILVPVIVQLAFGAVAIWLAQRPYDALARMATIGWGIGASSLLAIATGFALLLGGDIAVVGFLALVLLVAGAVPVIAFRSRPEDSTA